MARSGRGRLSSIDLLPDEAVPHVRAALDALAERRRTQDDIREELNNHLMALDIAPVSKSAFNRKALQVAVNAEKLMQGREIAAIMGEKLAEAGDGDVGLLLNETIKSLVYDVVMDAALSDESQSIKMLKEASITLMRLEQARSLNFTAAVKKKDNFVEIAGEAIEKAATESGLDAATVSQLRRDFLGIVKKADDQSEDAGGE